MARRKQSTKRSTSGAARSGAAKVKSVITSRPQLPGKQGTRGKDWYQAGPLWLQAPPFGQTDPFKETMGSKASQREMRMRRQNTRALRLLARAKRARKRR
jgi:hypothetical protein